MCICVGRRDIKFVRCIKLWIRYTVIGRGMNVEEMGMSALGRAHYIAFGFVRRSRRVSVDHSGSESVGVHCVRLCAL